MNQFNYYDEAENRMPEVANNFELAIPNIITSGLSNPQILPKRIVKQKVIGTVAQVTHEQCRTLISKNVINNVVALSMLEEQISKVNPKAAPRCKAIVDAYTSSACERLSKW